MTTGEHYVLMAASAAAFCIFVSSPVLSGVLIWLVGTLYENISLLKL